MRKYWLAVITVVVVSITGGDALAACSTPECLQATQWHGGFTAFVMTHDDLQGARGADQLVTSLGGRIALVTPRLMLGWIHPRVGRQVVGREGIIAVVRGPLDLNRLHQPGKNRQAEEHSRALGNFFNAVVSGEMAGRIEAGLRVQGPPLVNDGLSRFERADHHHADAGLEAETQGHIGPPWKNASMLGRVVVNVFQIESNGAPVASGSPDTNTHTWTWADMNTNINEVLLGLTFWSNEAAARAKSVTFYMGVFGAFDTVTQQGYEPILHSSADDYLWINEIMRQYVPPYQSARPGGYGSTLPLTWLKVHNNLEAFNDDQRGRISPAADHAFVIFVGYNPVGSPLTFTNGRFAYAYFGGPYSQMLFENGGWGPNNFNRVMTHETGHIFWACDEYFQAGYGGCTTCANCYTSGPRPSVSNQACNNPNTSCLTPAALCMMKANDFTLCAYTPAQVGW